MTAVGQNKGIFDGFRKTNKATGIFGLFHLFLGSSVIACFTFVHLSYIQTLLPNEYDIRTVFSMSTLPMCSLTFYTAIECPVAARASLGWSRFGTTWCVTLDMLSCNRETLLFWSVFCWHAVVNDGDVFVGVNDVYWVELALSRK